MATTTTTPLTDAPPAPPVYLTNIFGTRKWKLTAPRLAKVKPLLNKLGVSFVPTGSTQQFRMKFEGVVLNTAELQTKHARRAEVAALRRQTDDMRKTYLTTAEAARKDKTLVSRVDAESLNRFIDSVATMPEVIEVARPGHTLDKVPTKFKVEATDFMGLRFWPVVISRREAGGSRYMITPPIAFRFGPEGVRASDAGHPHVYDSTAICQGDGAMAFASGNPFLIVPTLREWVMGYRTGDQASTTWVSVARRWWTINKAAFFGAFDDEHPAQVIIAPWTNLAHSELHPLTPHFIDEFVAAGQGDTWALYQRRSTPKADTAKSLLAKDVKPTALKALLDTTNERCVECGQPAVAMVTFPADASATDPKAVRTYALCSCDAALMPFERVDKHPAVHHEAVVLEPLTTRIANCRFPACGDPECLEHGVRENPGHPAVLMLVVPGHMSYPICTQHVHHVQRHYKVENGDEVHVAETSVPTVSAAPAVSVEVLSDVGVEVHADTDVDDTTPLSLAAQDGPFRNYLTQHPGRTIEDFTRDIRVRFGTADVAQHGVLCRACGGELSAHRGLRCSAALDDGF